MTPTLYVETNFLVGFAKGQIAPLAGMGSRSLPLRVAMPDACIMEAFSCIEAERKTWNVLLQQLQTQKREASRDTSSGHAERLAGALEGAIIAGSARLNDVEIRLRQALEWMIEKGELLRLAPAGLKAAMDQPIPRDPTDNLILRVVLDDASPRRPAPMAFVSGNHSDFDQPEVSDLLVEAGIRYFRNVDAATGWLASLTGT